MLSKKLNRIYLLSFLFSLHVAISAYVNSSFLVNFVSEKYVGILYTISSVLALVLLSKSVNILKYFGNKKLTLGFLFLNILSLLGLIFSKNPYTIGASFVLFSATNTLIFFCIDIFVEHFGDPKQTGKIRGLYLTIINIAWMLSPLVAAFMITKEGGYKAIYSLALLIVSIMTIGLTMSVKTFKDQKYRKIPFIETFKFLTKNKDIMSIAFINFLLHFFFAWMVVYTPIYLIDHLGFTWDQIGVIFTVMLSPFVIFGLPIGILIDKYNVKKTHIMSLGFLITIISTGSIAFIKEPSLSLWAIVLFATRVGASMIESGAEIYFFSKIKDEDADLISIYRDMNPLSYIIAPILATIVFLFLPFNYLFLILAIILSFGFYLISNLKNSNAISN